MNFDGKTGIKQTCLRGPAQVISPSATVTTGSITPSGYRHALFHVQTAITGARVVTGKIEHSEDGSTNWTEVSGTSFSMSVAAGDGAEGLRSILVAHDAAREYLRMSLTQGGGTNVAPVVGVIQFNPAVDLGTSTFNLVVN